MDKQKEQVYLGDGVYASFDGLHVVLETYGDIIYLDDCVLNALILYAQRVGLLKESDDGT